MMAAAGGPFDAKSLAAQFKRTRATEKKIAEVLASLVRLGYVTSEDGKTFAPRRVAWPDLWPDGQKLPDGQISPKVRPALRAKIFRFRRRANQRHDSARLTQ